MMLRFKIILYIYVLFFLTAFTIYWKCFDSSSSVSTFIFALFIVETISEVNPSISPITQNMLLILYPALSNIFNIDRRVKNLKWVLSIIPNSLYSHSPSRSCFTTDQCLTLGMLATNSPPGDNFSLISVNTVYGSTRCSRTSAKIIVSKNPSGNSVIASSTPPGIT